MKHIFLKSRHYSKHFALGGDVEKFAIPHIGPTQTYDLTEAAPKFGKGGKIGEVEIKALHEFIKEFVSVAPKELHLNESIMIDNIDSRYTYAASLSFFKILENGKKQKEDSVDAYIVLGVALHTNKPHVRTYDVRFSIQGQTDEGTIKFVTNNSGSEIKEVIEKFHGNYPSLKDCMEKHKIKFKGIEKTPKFEKGGKVSGDLLTAKFAILDSNGEEFEHDLSAEEIIDMGLTGLLLHDEIPTNIMMLKMAIASIEGNDENTVVVMGQDEE